MMQKPGDRRLSDRDLFLPESVFEFGQRDVRLLSYQLPHQILIRRQREIFVAAEFGRLDAARLPVKLEEANDRADADAPLLRSFRDGGPALDRPNHSPTQILRIRLRHACWPPPSRHLESRSRPHGNPRVSLLGKRSSFAPKLFGSVELDKLVDVEPLWRPLLTALSAQLEVSWAATVELDRGWFPGRVSLAEPAAPTAMRGELCADPRAEVVEALRWTRELLSRGDASAGDIAITGAATPAWDEHILALARQAGIPVHFSHGLPALNSWEGQSCAALADVLGNGLNQERVRRLLMHSSSSAMGALPDDWAAGLPQQAGLFTVDQWRRALQSARGRRSDPDAAERTLIPMLELLATGIANAEQAGKSFLGGASLGLWKDALRNAPPAAIAMSLESLRVRDDRHPANSVVWCPASHLVAAPRRWMRLLGVAGRTWPRSESEDPLLPDQVLSRRRLIPVSITQRDRRCFDLLVTQPAEEIVVSRSRRSADGALQSASALWPATAPVRTCARTRIPEHAFSEADRLLARPAEAGRSGRIKAALTRAVSRLHSATSLMLMARHPLGFLWRYALDMNS